MNHLIKYTYLSIFAALITIFLKLIAYFITNSVGLLSDAVESLVNFASALIAFFALKIAQKPADKNHPYGHTKAEYFSSIAEGIFIFFASLAIIFSAFNRLFYPKPLEKISLGLLVSIMAAVINFFVGQILIKVGKKNQSITLEADGQHLMTDVWTSVGVIFSVFLVDKTKILILDPLVAIFVALNILFTGTSLIRRSLSGFMDETIDKKDLEKIEGIFEKYEKKGLVFHEIKSRKAGQKKFLSFHALFPNDFTIKKAHDLIYKIEKEIKEAVFNIQIESHLEPKDDKKSFES
jgi:cation diffusion facilitator family transporter